LNNNNHNINHSMKYLGALKKVDGTVITESEAFELLKPLLET